MSHKHQKNPVVPRVKEVDDHSEEDKSRQTHHAGILGTLVSENLRSVVVALVTAAIGTVGLLLSPLRNVVAHWIWHEKALILLTTDTKRVIEGSSIQLRIAVTPVSSVQVDKGVIEIVFDHQLLRLQSGQTTFASPVIESPSVLPEGNPIEFLEK